MLFNLAGCRVALVRSLPSEAAANMAFPPFRLHADAVSVQQSPEYQQAVKLYARHDYRGALAALGRLEAAPGRTEADRVFLQRQRQICEAAQDRGRPDQRPALMNQGPTSTDQRRSPHAPERATRVLGQADCGPRALLLVCRKLGVAATLEELRQKAGTTGRGTTLEGLAKAARAKGLKADGVHTDRDALANLNAPAIAWVEGDHYLAVLSVDGDQATIHDPNRQSEEAVTTDELLRRSGGILLKLTR